MTTSSAITRAGFASTHRDGSQMVTPLESDHPDDESSLPSRSWLLGSDEEMPGSRVQVRGSSATSFLPSPPDSAEEGFRERLDRHLYDAIQYALRAQDRRGAWQIEPDPRLFDTGLVAYVLSRVEHAGAAAAARRARPWLERFPPQSHDPYARLFDETPRRLLMGTRGPLDLRDPTLYGDVLRRKTLLLYVLALHAGAKVLSPYEPSSVKEQVRQFYLRRDAIEMKTWSKVDLVSIYISLEALDGNKEEAEAASQKLASMQAPDGSFCHNPVSTAIAFLALSAGAPGSGAWKRCLAHLLQAQRPDGAWSFCTMGIWDTSLMLRVFTDHPLFAEAAPRAVRFLLESQNPDGGWGFRTGVESDNDTSACVLLALRRFQGGNVAFAVDKGSAYLLARQREDGLWNTWQSSEDHPVEDCVAHILRALAALRGSHAVSIRAAQRWLEQQYALHRWKEGWYRNRPYRTLEVSKALPAGHPIAGTAARALCDLQNLDGGFSPESDEESTPSATGLAVAALIKHCGIHQPSVPRALTYLMDAQRPDGSWPGRPEIFGPRPLICHLPTNTHAFGGLGLMAAWQRLLGGPETT
jgi:squalene-hopene/tetraprenyl-beta-curcumene cyclase